MAFTQTQLDDLEAAYAAGATSVHIGDKTIDYGSLEDLWQVILRVRQALASSSTKYTHGTIRFRPGV